MKLSNRLKDMKILLVDDDEWIRDSLRLFFESEGCSLTPVETAEEGLKALRNQRYDIIITEYSLPGIGGLDFLRETKKSNIKALKIVLTTQGNHGITEKTKMLGVHSLITKPFTANTVEMVISKLLETGVSWPIAV